MYEIRDFGLGVMDAGKHEVTWNGKNDAGQSMSSGVYFYRVDVGGERRQGKLTLVR